MSLSLLLNCRYGWKKVALVYSKDGHQSWSGTSSCWAFMTTLVKVAREENIQIDEIKLDSTDKLYPNDTRKMLEEQKSLFNEFGGKWFNLIYICFIQVLPLASSSLCKHFRS